MPLVSKMSVPIVVKFAATGDNTISQRKINLIVHLKGLNFCGILLLLLTTIVFYLLVGVKLSSINFKSNQYALHYWQTRINIKIPLYTPIAKKCNIVTVWLLWPWPWTSGLGLGLEGPGLGLKILALTTSLGLSHNGIFYPLSSRLMLGAIPFR